MADASTSASITASLSGLGLSSDDINSAISGYTGLAGNATDALMNIADKGISDAASLSPLVAVGLSAIGVGPAGVAAVSVALPVLDLISSLFSSPAPHCNWTVGRGCFQTAVRPYGPTDPNWVTFDSLVNSDFQLAMQAFPWSWQVLSEVGAKGFSDGDVPIDPSDRDAIEQFIYAYDVAWKANAEYWINGYTGLSETQLLDIVRDAWNAAHSNSSTFTFKGTPVDASTEAEQMNIVQWPNNMKGYAKAQGVKLSAPGTRTYIGMLIDGAITPPTGGAPTASPPITINTGPRQAPTYSPHVVSAGTTHIAAKSKPVVVPSLPPHIVLQNMAKKPVPVKKEPVATIGLGIAGAAVAGPIGAVAGLAVGALVDHFRK